MLKEKIKSFFTVSNQTWEQPGCSERLWSLHSCPQLIWRQSWATCSKWPLSKGVGLDELQRFLPTSVIPTSTILWFCKNWKTTCSNFWLSFCMLSESQSFWRWDVQSSQFLLLPLNSFIFFFLLGISLWHPINDLVLYWVWQCSVMNWITEGNY